MLYHKVKQEVYLYSKNKLIYIYEGELLTVKECQKLGLNIKRMSFVEISSHKTFKLFGVRRFIKEL